MVTTLNDKITISFWVPKHPFHVCSVIVPCSHWKTCINKFLVIPGSELDPAVIVLGVLLTFCVTVIAVHVFYVNPRRVCEHCKGRFIHSCTTLAVTKRCNQNSITKTHTQKPTKQTNKEACCSLYIAAALNEF